MSETARQRPVPGIAQPRVTRSRRNVAWTGVGAVVVVVVLFLFPYYIGPGTTGIMEQALIVLTLASMWNLLAGYAGLVSVGQQAFFGLGAYFVLIPAMHGITPCPGCRSPRSAPASARCRCGGWCPGCGPATSRSRTWVLAPRSSCCSSSSSAPSAAAPACRCPG